MTLPGGENFAARQQIGSAYRIMPQLYLYLAALILLISLGRVVFRGGSKPVDWALEVAFIRLDFPPQQRDLAQWIAAGLAEIVGLKIKQLRPEHTLKEISGWADDPVSAISLIRIFHAAFAIQCDDNTTFRVIVERIAEKRTRKSGT
jgi:hypothetical protein